MLSAAWVSTHAARPPRTRTRTDSRGDALAAVRGRLPCRARDARSTIITLTHSRGAASRPSPVKMISFLMAAHSVKRAQWEMAPLLHAHIKVESTQTPGA